MKNKINLKNKILNFLDQFLFYFIFALNQPNQRLSDLYGNLTHAHLFKIFLNMCYCSNKDFLYYSYEVVAYNATFDETFYAYLMSFKFIFL